MALTDTLIRSTLGLVSTRFRTVGDWAVVYRRIVDTKPICDKTKINRRCSLRHIVDALGSRIMSRVLPHEIAELALVTGQRRSDLGKMSSSDVWDDCLHVSQLKTGMRLELPLALRLNAIGVSLTDAIADCRDYAAGTLTLLRKHNGQPVCLASMSARFEEARNAVIPMPTSGLPASLHECRSLSERLYRAQGINTMVLLGHRHQSMTDLYDDPRDLSDGQHGWKRLEVA